MRFQDFTRQQLIGKAVLWTQAGGGRGVVKVLSKITATPPEGFLIDGADAKVFDYFTGNQKAHTGRMTSIVSKCELVSEQQIEQIRNEWNDIQVKRAQKVIAEQRQALQDNLAKAAQLHKDMTELQDRLQINEQVTNKLQLINIVTANIDRLSALTVPQLRQLIQQMQIPNQQ